MKDNYILRFESGLLMCFYQDDDQNLYSKQFANNRWSAPSLIFQNVQPNYTITLTEEGTIYIFCQDIEGSIILITREKDNSNWSNKVILKNQSENIHAILFNPFILKNQMTLLYNIPGENRTSKLISQSLNDNGVWGQPQQIDSFIPDRNRIYQIQKVSPAHYIAFYRANVRESNIGYREITPEKWTDFNYIHQTGYNITDSSFLTTDDGIHSIFTVKSMFSSQLIYRKRAAGGFTPPQVICEGQRIENCLISIIKNCIYVTFISNGQLYFCISRNNGISFSAPEPFRHKLCKEPVKAIYISQDKMAESHIFIRELYVDKYSPWDIQFIPEIIPEFINGAVPEESEITAASIEPRQNEFYNPEKGAQQLNGLLEESIYKDQQLQNLSNILKDRTQKLDESKSSIEKMKGLYTQKINQLETRISNLTAENERLLREIHNYAKQKKASIIPIEEEKE